MKLLVAHGAEVTCKDKKSYTPLHAAASSGMISVVKYLLDLGVDVGIWTEQYKRMEHFICCDFIVGRSYFKFKRLFHTIMFLSFKQIFIMHQYLIKTCN